MAKKRTAVAFGSFDIIHPGHIHYLKGAARYGRLTVVVARDSTVRMLKGADPAMDERSRAKIVGAIKFVDDVVIGSKISRPEELYKILIEIRPDTIVLGYDQKVDISRLNAFLKKNGLKSRVVRISPYKAERFKSSKIKQHIIRISLTRQSVDPAHNA
jgi:FAD synthetase